MSKEAMRQALEALEYYELPDEPNTASGAANALREALAQPAERQGEAVPYGRVTVVRRPGCGDQHWFYPWPDSPYLDNAAECHNVYTHTAPAQQQGAEQIDAIACERYKVVPSHESMFHRWAVVAGDGTRQLYIGREVECQNMARKFAGAFLDGAYFASHPAPAQQPLSDEAMWHLWNMQGNDCMDQRAAIKFARAIEATHKIGGEKP